MKIPLIIKVYFSPFKPPIPKFYIGKIAIGVPYFLPRCSVKATPKRALKATVDEIRETRAFNKRNTGYKKTEKAFRDIYNDKMRCCYFVPMTIGFSSCSLGWKTKWTNTDFRHEWNPVWSFVFFGYQIALIFRPEHDVHYWESYLFYSKATDKSKSTKERIEEAMREFPNIWTSHSAGKEEKINYWQLIIKDRYLK
ncbi:MAG TPA: hypothetical protein VLA48_03510 [Nitrososphaeraceae archaeon]|nr:hypothetical protein [Nitrososphaeraceae archaeon]